jgi:hypothetical protein
LLRPWQLLLVFALTAGAASAHANATPARPQPSLDCATLDPNPGLELAGARLRLAPDLHERDARLIDVQFGHGECRQAAEAGLARLRAQRPGDPALEYLEARARVLGGQGEAAEPGLRRLLAAHPQLGSARVLLASLLLDKEQRVEAGKLLAQAIAASPEDFRAAFQLLRLRALEAPKGDGVGQLFQVLRDRRLPPETREIAQVSLLYITALDFAQKEAALREALTFQSQTSLPAKANNLARLLAEESDNYAAAREVLQGVLAKPASPPERDYARLLMAETWLFEAANLDPQPSVRNAALVAKAKAQMAGDLLPLAKRINRWHALAPLRPFVTNVADPDARDGAGLSALCRAAQALDAGAVRASLAAGAKVDGECAGATALAYVVRAGPGDFPRKRAVLQVLLEQGAFPDPPLYAGSSYTAMSFCADNFPECQRELLPLLADYQARWRARPESSQ